MDTKGLRLGGKVSFNTCNFSVKTGIGFILGFSKNSFTDTTSFLVMSYDLTGVGHSADNDNLLDQDGECLHNHYSELRVGGKIKGVCCRWFQDNELKLLEGFDFDMTSAEIRDLILEKHMAWDSLSGISYGE